MCSFLVLMSVGAPLGGGLGREGVTVSWGRPPPVIRSAGPDGQPAADGGQHLGQVAEHGITPDEPTAGSASTVAVMPETLREPTDNRSGVRLTGTTAVDSASPRRWV